MGKEDHIGSCRGQGYWYDYHGYCLGPGGSLVSLSCPCCELICPVCCANFGGMPLSQLQQPCHQRKILEDQFDIPNTWLTGSLAAALRLVESPSAGLLILLGECNVLLLQTLFAFSLPNGLMISNLPLLTQVDVFHWVTKTFAFSGFFTWLSCACNLHPSIAPYSRNGSPSPCLNPSLQHCQVGIEVQQDNHMLLLRACASTQSQVGADEQREKRRKLEKEKKMRLLRSLQSWMRCAPAPIANFSTRNNWLVEKKMPRTISHEASFARRLKTCFALECFSGLTCQVVPIRSFRSHVYSLHQTVGFWSRHQPVSHQAITPLGRKLWTSF
jgi:hypothetical protein